MNLPRQVEEASLNAWPALNTVLYDGWLLRLANGYTKRANSVNGFYPSVLPVEGKIEQCEALYQAHGLPAIFRLTPFIEPADLDGLLVRYGYRQIDHTRVQLLRLKGRPLVMAAGVEIFPTDADLASWLALFHQLNPGRRDMTTHERLLRQVTGETCLMVLEQDGEIVACGLGILANGLLGLFDIVTEAGQRHKGYGTTLTRSLLAWGQERGAEYAYLQVMTNNAPARKLYAELGFKDIYHYWYRVKTENLKQNQRKTKTEEEIHE